MHAARLRGDGVKQFEGKFSATRRIQSERMEMKPSDPTAWIKTLALLAIGARLGFMFANMRK